MHRSRCPGGAQMLNTADSSAQYLGTIITITVNNIFNTITMRIYHYEVSFSLGFAVLASERRVLGAFPCRMFSSAAE